MPEPTRPGGGPNYVVSGVIAMIAAGITAAVITTLTVVNLKITEQAAPSVSAAGSTTIYSDSTTHRTNVSNNGGSYASLVTGPSAGPVTIAGPTAARTMTVPDANFTAARTDAGQTFTGVQVMTSPSFTTPVLGTPTSGTLTNCTGLPEAGLTLADNTTNNVSATAHGFCPKFPNNTTTFLRGDGTYAAAGGTPDPRTGTVYLYDEMFGFLGTGVTGSGSIGPFGFQPAFSGSNSGVNGDTAFDTTAPGVLKLLTGTTNSGRAAIGSANVNGQIYFGGGGVMTMAWRVYLSTASNGTDRYTIRCGIGNSVSAEPTRGVFFLYSDNVNSGNWQAVAENAGATTANTTTATAGSTWYELKIIVNAAGTSADYYINGVNKCTVSSGLPSSAYMGYPFCSIVKSAGTTDVDAWIDYAFWSFTPTGR